MKADLRREARLLVEDEELNGATVVGGGQCGLNCAATMSEVVASQVSVRDLKTHISEWLGRVQVGEVVEVTSHRKPIARITAVRQTDQVSTNPLQKAIDAGIVSWNGQKPNLLPPVKLRGKGKLMSDIVIEDRGLPDQLG